eukprot:CAMPEP_0175127854 /NCGR_PEP_ID=MMETSP0087-20121206/4613_1 /TAXON_ID=136419 /ORGANISM="Unknown Unknown, Strain D1" /LENGTH=102 /DNA_ID=CAMNT_0016409869 /DNA_START=296 /DNA_END=604 /DNA_ORIENTATION=+
MYARVTLAGGCVSVVGIGVGAGVGLLVVAVLVICLCRKLCKGKTRGYTLAPTNYNAGNERHSLLDFELGDIDDEPPLGQLGPSLNDPFPPVDPKLPQVDVIF